MIDNCNDGGGGIVSDILDWRDCDGLEATIEVPMLKPTGITCDNRGLIAMYVVSVIAVTTRMLIFVLVLVVVIVRFTCRIVVMDVRMVSSAMAMIEGAHDFSRMRSNRKWSLYGVKENRPSAVRSMRCPDWDRAKQVIDDAQLIGKEQPEPEAQKS